MGLSAAAALLLIALAFLAQTPRALTRLGLTGSRLDLRARALTGLGLAAMLLAFGFFVAGVPLGEPEAVASATTAPGAAGAIVAEDVAGTIDGSEVMTSTGVTGTGAMLGLPNTQTRQPGESGAVAGLASPPPELANAQVLTGTQAADVAPPPTATPSPSPTETPTPLPTATPTSTPSPTPTPTPIGRPVATINDQTSTLPIRRTPGGEPLGVVIRGDIVIPLTGHANHSGELWRQISTVDGVVGWIPEVFLDYGDGEG